VPEPPARVLVCGLNWIGDGIMSMPALECFRRLHPGCHLTMLVKSRVAPLWQRHPAADELLILSECTRGFLTQARSLSDLGFDCAYVLPNSFRSALIPFVGRVPVRIGFRGHSRRFLLTEVRSPRGGAGREHQAYEYLDLLVPGYDAELPPPRLPVAAEDAARVRDLVGEIPRPWLGIVPGAARGPAKQWPWEQFAGVAARWTADGGGTVILGTEAEGSTCAGIAAAAGAAGRSLAGSLSLRQWVAALSLCDVVVGNDSGGVHAAAATGVPVVAIFGLTDPEKTRPLGAPCRVVQNSEIRARDVPRNSELARKCLASISAERVYQAAAELRGLKR